MSLIQVSHLTFSYDGSFDNVFEDVSFQIDSDWRLGLIGRNGRGKTTLLRLLQGNYEYRGDILADIDFEYFPCPVEDPAAPAREVLLGKIGMHEEWELLRELSLLRVPEGTDVAETAAQIEQSANPNKWVCVGAEKTIVKTRGNVVLLVMSQTAIADQIAANFDAYQP